MFSTVTIDTSIDQTKHRPRVHETLEDAQRFAQTESSRKKGEIQVLDSEDNVVDVYSEGVSILY